MPVYSPFHSPMAPMKNTGSWKRTSRQMKAWNQAKAGKERAFFRRGSSLAAKATAGSASEHPN